jgi:hypothetical protein
LYAATKALVTTEPNETTICAMILEDYNKKKDTCTVRILYLTLYPDLSRSSFTDPYHSLKIQVKRKEKKKLNEPGGAWLSLPSDGLDT